MVCLEDHLGPIFLQNPMGMLIALPQRKFVTCQVLWPLDAHQGGDCTKGEAIEYKESRPMTAAAGCRALVMLAAYTDPSVPLPLRRVALECSLQLVLESQGVGPAVRAAVAVVRTDPAPAVRCAADHVPHAELIAHACDNVWEMDVRAQCQGLWKQQDEVGGRELYPFVNRVVPPLHLDPDVACHV